MASDDPSLEIINRNAKGDLIVIVGSEIQQKFKCNKDALRMASDTWHAMLENKTEAHGTVDELVFADDDSGALRVLLLAAHQRGDILPPVNSLKALAKVARLCDKYACEETIKDTVLKWMRPHIKKAIKHNFDASWRIWISWSFLTKKEFIEATAYLIDDIAPLDFSGLLKKTKLPPPVTRYLVQRIEERYGQVLNKVYDALANIKQCNASCLTAPTQANRAAAPKCENLRAGAVIRFFAECNLPIDASLRPAPLLIQRSLDRMQEIITKLCKEVSNEVKKTAHTECLYELDRIKDKIYSLNGNGHEVFNEELAARFRGEDLGIKEENPMFVTPDRTEDDF